MFIKQGWSTCIPPKSRKALWMLVPAGKAKLGRQLYIQVLGPNPAFQGALLTQLSQAPGKVVSWFQ